jgi:cytochrome b pre-mRNA-processing protein 3
MLAWLRKRRDERQTARSIYGSIVTRARAPAFYAEWGVPDTLQGRFEMIVLHLALVLHRLAAEGDAGDRLARALTEVFVVDLDDAMREMTFGDLAVPREVKRAAAALFDRHEAYRRAVASPQEAALAQAIAAEFAYLDDNRRLDAPALAAYVRGVTTALAAQSSAEVLAGAPAWPQLGHKDAPQKGAQ